MIRTTPRRNYFLCTWL